MSSVAGSRSVHGGSEETFDNVCEPCHYRGIQKQGISYCQNCQEKLCQTCADTHKGQKMSRNHDLVAVSKFQTKAVPQQRATCIVMCDCSQSSAVVVYCRDHDDVICQSCAVTKHRTCKTISICEKCASYPKEKFAAVALRASKLNDKTDQLLDERKSNLKSYATVTDKAKEDIQKYRQEINRQIDMMEQAMLSDLDDRESRNRQEVDGHISSCTTTKQFIQTDLKILNDAKKTADKADMFAADVKVSKRLVEYDNLLKDIHGETKSQGLTFRKNDQILDMLVNIKNIGTLVEHNFEADRRKKSVFTDLKVERVDKKDVKISTDQNTPLISGCIFIPDDHVVLCDNSNKKLKLFDRYFKLQDSLDLKGSPWDISVVIGTTALITLPSQQQLQYIELTPRLKLGRALLLNKKCWGVRVFGSDIYVTCHSGYPGGDGEVRILDKNGILKNRHDVNLNQNFMFKTPFYLTLTDRSNKIYVSDFVQDTLTSLKSDGTVIFQYTDPELSRPRSVCVDDEDNAIFVARILTIST